MDIQTILANLKIEQLNVMQQTAGKVKGIPAANSCRCLS